MAYHGERGAGPAMGAAGGDGLSYWHYRALWPRGQQEKEALVATEGYAGPLQLLVLALLAVEKECGRAAGGWGCRGGLGDRSYEGRD